MSRRNFWLILLAFIIAWLPARDLRADPQYYFYNLADFSGPGEANALNDSGEVVGRYYHDGAREAFKWSPSQGLHSLGFLDEREDRSCAYDINNFGQVVGSSYHEHTFSGGTTEWVEHAVLWDQDGTIHDLGSRIGSYEASTAYAINDNGTSVGSGTKPSGSLYNRTSTKWGATGGYYQYNHLPNGEESRARGINNNGEFAGTSGIVALFANNYRTRAIYGPFPDNGNFVVLDLGILGGLDGNAASSRGYDINNSRQIVGSTYDKDNKITYACLWNPTEPFYYSWEIQDLGTLLEGSSSYALAINDEGHVVGVSDERPFLWLDDNMYDLHSLAVNLPEGVTLLTANDINNLGWIVGEGKLGSTHIPFLLTPEPIQIVPLPSTLILLGSGLLGLGVLRTWKYRSRN